MTTQLSSTPAQSGEEIKTLVRDRYARAVTESGESPDASAAASIAPSPRDTAALLGYAAGQLDALPAAVLENKFGCGNPLLFAGVKPGDVVLDVGSGAGMDVLLAAEITGPTGRVIGLDMTPEMIVKARENAVTAGAKNVEFRLGDMERMPIEDSSVDWVISNCVINLAPDKPKVFSEISRVLKPGGRLSVSDIVTGRLAGELIETKPLWAHCIGGAIEEVEYLGMMKEAGLDDVNVTSRQFFDETAMRGITASFSNEADRKLVLQLLERYPDTVEKIWSSRITGRKPG